jgi:NAD(P)-dependent dehydrogenase (short-subunit alcohol dehydrogenase family)
MALLSDKVVVIVGGAGLLGRRFCRAAADEAARVVVADRDEAAAAAVVRDIESAGGSAVAMGCDIASPASVDALVASTHGRFGRIDAVVNSAYPRNRHYGRPVEQVEYSDFVENTSLNLGGCFLVAQRFAVAFCRQGFGNIVNVASIYGSLAPRFSIYEGTGMTMPVEYSAIKAGMLQLTRYFAQYYKRQGVRCNCLSPGGILDGQPQAFVEAYGSHAGRKGMLDPDDLAGALVFLLSNRSAHMTGQNLVVDDGFSL